MSYLDQLNDLCSGQEVAKGGGAPHPICSNAPGIVESVEQKTGKNSGKIYWDLTIKTNLGITWYKIFDVTEDDVADAMSSPDNRKRLGATIGRVKRLFSDLGVATPEQVASWKWSDNRNPSESLLHHLQYLSGKTCSITVAPYQKKPGETITFVGASNPSNLYGQASHAGLGIPGGNAYASAPPQHNQQPQQTVYTPPSIQPGSQPNLDAIPF